MNDYICWHWHKTVPSWEESSLHRRVISEPFCEPLQVSRTSAARMHFWNSCLKIWGKLGWKNSHMILQPLEYFWLSSTKSNVTWQPYAIKNSPLTNRATRHHDGQTEAGREMCTHLSLSFFILVQSILAFNNSDEREDFTGWLWLSCHAARWLQASCPERAWASCSLCARADPWAQPAPSFQKVWMSLFHL